MKALLELLFENTHVRVISNGRVLFVANDVCAALEISKPRDAIARLEPYEKTTVRLTSAVHKGGGVLHPSPGGNSVQQDGRNSRGNPNVTAVTEAGLYRLIFSSRKQAAMRFSRWVTEEVLPQIAKYGSYLPGATAAERCTALRLRWKRERAELLEREAGALEQSGLFTIAAFRQIHAIPARDAFAFARTVQYQAGLVRIKARRFFQKGGMRSAWPASLLLTAMLSFQPRLALEWNLPVSAR
jgi:prophage antirepressor-like protein